MSEKVEVHPVQRPNTGYGALPAKCPKVVTTAAYEVYRHVYGAQEAMVTGDCRGGFSTGELIAFLYARSFPITEWSQRVDEAFTGMEHL